MRGDDDHQDAPPRDDCVLPPSSPPAHELSRHAVNQDPDTEQDIYVEIEARGETVQHVERIKSEFVFGDEFVVWDVTTDQDRWWVITNLTNLYSQRYFPSLDYTLSLHVGLMMRMRSQPVGADIEEPSPFDDVFRRQEQAKDRLDHAVEAEDFQTVGMLLRECLLSLASALRRRVDLGGQTQRPQDSNFTDWAALITNKLCAGKGNKKLRKHLRKSAQDTWQLVSWLTHDRDANWTAASIAVHACDTVVGHFVQILERHRTDRTDHCPACQSRHLRTHFDLSIHPDGDYYLTCGSCGWSSHPEQTS